MAMMKLALRGLLARKMRLALMLFAIVIGVTWIVGTLIVTDSLDATFDTLVEDIEGSIDLTVRAKQEFGESSDRAPVDEPLVDVVRRVEGVRAAEGRLAAFSVVPIKANGEAVKTMGPPLIGVNYGDDPELSQLVQVEGRRPKGEAEFNLDVDTARDGDFVVGQTYQISLTAGTKPFTLVGLVGFNSAENDTVGAVITVFDTPTAQKMFGRVDQFDEIGVLVTDDARTDAIRAQIAAVLPDGVEVVAREVKVAEGQEEFNEISSIFGNVLLGFGAIIVVVVAFLINNTFRIVISQRIRELALLRALGATGRQVVRAVIFEALLLGLVATAIGFGLGIGFAKVFTAILNAIGFGLPSSELRLTPRTVIAAVFVGVVVTLLSALLPVLKVRKIPPIAALRDDFRLDGSGLRRRLITGGAMTALGAVLIAWGLFGSLETRGLLTNLAIGALTIFLGVNLLSPVFSIPVARVLGAPIARFRGIAGALARDNAARSPRRTAATAAALMIGLALIAMTAVVGDSIKQTFLSTLNTAVKADYLVRNDNANQDPTAGFSPAVAADLRARPEFSSVIAYRFTFQGIKVQDKLKDANGADFAALADHLDLDVIDGAIPADDDKALLLHRDSAEDLGVGVGDTLEITFVDQQTETVTVRAVFADASVLGNWVLPLALWEAHFPRDIDQFVTLRLADGVGPEAARRALDAALTAYPQVTAQDRVEFRDAQEKQLDGFLAIIQGFLGLSFVIAIVGIFNTLQLSVFERTRELGLLRAVGMSRGQMRAMVRWEAVIVAVFGAVLGLALGVLFGVAVATAIPNTIVKSISIPVGSLVFYVVISALGGLLASLYPAWRASKLNVLDAIAHV